jgi:hypothetical protein
LTKKLAGLRLGDFLHKLIWSPWLGDSLIQADYWNLKN